MFKLTLIFSVILILVGLASTSTVLKSQNTDQKLQYYLYLGDSLKTVGKLKEAKAAYKKALKIDKNTVKAFRGLGQIGYKKDNWGDVKKWFERVLEIQYDDLEAKYYLGIAHRETGKFQASFLRSKDYGKSRRNFEFVIEKDSTFEDVLYQRALLERRGENWLKAIEWGHRQVNLKPDLTHAQLGLFDFYRSFLIHKGDTEVEDWLKRQGGEWSIYFLGEQHRRKNSYTQADSIFQDCLTKDLSVSKTLILLSLVRLNIQQGNENEAHKYYWWVVDSMESELDAKFLFEDSKYIFTDSELEQYNDLTRFDEKRDFFGEFWVQRDPIPASPINECVVEYYKRILIAEKDYWYDGIRSWFNNPDRLGELKFPKTYYLNHEFNDKGLIYLRHGEPHDKAMSPSGLRNESWRYYQEGDCPELILHFLIGDASSNNWRLVPYLRDRNMLKDRLDWHYTINNIYNARTEIEFNSYLYEMATKSGKDVYKALTSYCHTW